MPSRDEPRISVCQDGSVYMIRDRFTDTGRFFGCEYATIDGLEVVWRECPEGVEYTAIEPFITSGVKDGIRSDRPI
jgi:hypothetical protein